MALIVQVFAVLLLASAVSAQGLFCPPNGGAETYSWYPNSYPTVLVQTTSIISTMYTPNLVCNFTIRANIPGRIVVRVMKTDIAAYFASISIRTDPVGMNMAFWSHMTYNEDRDGSFISSTNRLFIHFKSASGSFIPSTGVQLMLTFLKSTDCLPSWQPVTLAGARHCVGFPTAKTLQFGPAQRFCTLHRSNLLVSDRDNVSTVLNTLRATNVWIGMTADPAGFSASVFRWINGSAVSRNVTVTCANGCRPGSATHRCVYAAHPRYFGQVECGHALRPLCYMPVGGSDVFYS